LKNKSKDTSEEKNEEAKDEGKEAAAGAQDNVPLANSPIASSVGSM